MRKYAEVLRAFARARIPYLIIGAFGANLYARNIGLLIRTLDCDVFIPAKVTVLKRCLRVLARLGFTFEAGQEPLPEADPVVLRGIVRARACVHALRKDSTIDLPLSIAGFDFQTLWKRRHKLRISGVDVNVAALRDILRSKELAGRDKDRLFLATYRDALEQMLGSDEPRPRIGSKKSKSGRKQAKPGRNQPRK